MLQRGGASYRDLHLDSACRGGGASAQICHRVRDLYLMVALHNTVIDGDEADMDLCARRGRSESIHICSHSRRAGHMAPFPGLTAALYLGWHKRRQMQVAAAPSPGLLITAVMVSDGVPYSPVVGS